MTKEREQECDKNCPECELNWYGQCAEK